MYCLHNSTTPVSFRHLDPALVLIFFLTTVAGCALQEEKRIALIIGNSDYETATPLPMATKDAENMRQALKDSNFEIVGLGRSDNLRTKKNMKNLLDEFKERAFDADLAVFYFSGHGMQYKGANYLLPLDVNIKKPVDLENQAVILGDTLLTGERNPKTERADIVIIDACRNNSFSTGSRGLADTPAEPEMLLAFAALPGQTAADNGLYADTFRQVVEEFDNYRLQQLFDKVAERMANEPPDKRQMPVYRTTLTKDHYLREKVHAKLVFTY